MEKTVKINVEKDLVYLDINDILPFQGELKDLSKENYNRLRASILDVGYIQPINVWKNPKDNLYYTEDGHQRIRVLKEMRSTEKYNIPKIPCSVIIAPSEHVAKRIILYLVSQFGTISSQGLYEFQIANNIMPETLGDFKLPDFDVEKFKAEFFEEPIGKEGSQELNAEDFEDFSNKCPKCGFEFDVKAT